MLFQRQSRKYVGGVLMANGAICLIIALVSSIYSWHFVRNASRADGKIVRMIEQKGKDDHTAYYPVFTFHDSQGVEHTIHSSWGSFPPAFEVGEAVPVLYSPAAPTSARIDSFSSVWGLPTITGILSGVVLPAGLVVWFWPAIVGLFRRRPPVYAA